MQCAQLVWLQEVHVMKKIHLNYLCSLIYKSSCKSIKNYYHKKWFHAITIESLNHCDLQIKQESTEILCQTSMFLLIVELKPNQNNKFEPFWCSPLFIPESLDQLINAWIGKDSQMHLSQMHLRTRLVQCEIKTSCSTLVYYEAQFEKVL